MVESEAFLKDIVMNLETIQKFDSECDSIADQTYEIAKQNTLKLEELSKAMENN